MTSTSITQSRYCSFAAFVWYFVRLDVEDFSVAMQNFCYFSHLANLLQMLKDVLIAN